MTVENEQAGDFDEFLARRRKELGAWLRAERERLGLSATDFSRLVRVHRNTVRNYELGLRDPDAAYLSAATKLGVVVPRDLVSAYSWPKLSPGDVDQAMAVFFDLLSDYTGLRGTGLSMVFRLIVESYHAASEPTAQPLTLEQMAFLVRAAVQDETLLVPALIAASEIHAAGDPEPRARLALTAYNALLHIPGAAHLTDDSLLAHARDLVRGIGPMPAG